MIEKENSVVSIRKSDMSLELLRGVYAIAVMLLELLSGICYYLKYKKRKIFNSEIKNGLKV